LAEVVSPSEPFRLGHSRGPLHAGGSTFTGKGKGLAAQVAIKVANVTTDTGASSTLGSQKEKNGDGRQKEVGNESKMGEMGVINMKNLPYLN